MKKNLFICLMFIFLSSAFPQAVKTGSVITISPPVSKNLEAADNWIPLFIQGQITADFQNYSDFKVIDRNCDDALTAEQKKMELLADVNNDTLNIQYAELLAADYMVAINIIKKGSSFFLDCKILDVKTSQNVGKVYSNSDISENSLTDGSIIHLASYELLRGIGVSGPRLEELKNKSSSSQNSSFFAENDAQKNVAKGIVAEQNGSNIEALTYYIKAKKKNKNLDEATKRMASLSATVSGGNFGKQAKNQIKQFKEWDTLLREAAELIAENPPEYRLMYFSDVNMDKINYSGESVFFSIGEPYLKQTNGIEIEEFVYDILNGLHKIPESKDWGDKINGFPWSYAEDIPGNNWLKKASSNDSNAKTVINSRIKPVVTLDKISGTEDLTGADWAQLKSNNDDFKFSIEKADKLDFSVKLLNKEKNLIAQKNITFYVEYIKRYNSHLISCNYSHMVTGKNDKARFVFDNVPIEKADSDEYYITIEQLSGETVSILPVPVGVLSYSQALNSNEKRIKVGGRIPDEELFNGQYFGWPLAEKDAVYDFSESTIRGIVSRIPFAEGTVLPDSIVFIHAQTNYAPGPTFYVYYCGSKLQWESARIQTFNVNYFATCNYKGD